MIAGTYILDVNTGEYKKSTLEFLGMEILDYSSASELKMPTDFDGYFYSHNPVKIVGEFKDNFIIIPAISAKAFVKINGEILGYMPQQQNLYDTFTGKQFLIYMAALKEIRTSLVESEVLCVSKRVNLLGELNKKLGAYSGGMKQRLLAAAAIMGEPKLLIMDEPTAGLYPCGDGFSTCHILSVGAILHGCRTLAIFQRISIIQHISNANKFWHNLSSPCLQYAVWCDNIFYYRLSAA